MLPDNESQIEQEMPGLDARLTPPPMTWRRSYSPDYDRPVIAEGVLVDPVRLALLEQVADAADEVVDALHERHSPPAVHRLKTALEALARPAREAQHG